MYVTQYTHMRAHKLINELIVIFLGNNILAINETIYRVINEGKVAIMCNT